MYIGGQYIHIAVFTYYIRPHVYTCICTHMHTESNPFCAIYRRVQRPRAKKNKNKTENKMKKKFQTHFHFPDLISAREEGEREFNISVP